LIEATTEDIKGADPEKLIWQTPDGLSIHPYYLREDLGIVAVLFLC
jgi:hypothetical protein